MPTRTDDNIAAFLNRRWRRGSSGSRVTRRTNTPLRACRRRCARRHPPAGKEMQ